MDFHELAIQQAKEGLQQGEVPVGCVFVKGQQILGRAHNQTTFTKNATMHCQIVAMQQIAKRLGPEVLLDSDLYVTCQPCIMCAYALREAAVKRVFYGCNNQRFGGNGSVVDVAEGQKLFRVYESVGGFRKEEAVSILKEFYASGNPNGKDQAAPDNKRHRPLK